MVKDTEKEEKEEKEKQEKEERKVTFWDRVPTIYKLGGVAIIFIQYLRLRGTDNMQELWFWVIGIVVAWYLIGRQGQKLDTGVLSPEEAEEITEREVQRKKKAGQIPMFAEVYVGPNAGLFHHEGMPQHYQIETTIITDTKKEYKRAIVNAEGPTKGYCTFQDNPGKLTGRETIPVISPIPQWFKRGKKLDLDFEKYLFGERK